MWGPSTKGKAESCSRASVVRGEEVGGYLRSAADTSTVDSQVITS